VTVLYQGHKPPELTDGSRLCWALPSPVHERSGSRASRPTGYKVMRSFRIVVHGPVLASRLPCHRDPARCGRAIIAPSSSRSRPLTRRLRRWPSASLDRASPRRQRSPPTNDALLTTYSPYKVQAETLRPPLRDGFNGRVEEGRGSLGHSATPRFPSPLIEPDLRVWRIRLPGKRSCLRPRQVTRQSR
jgi:hypothetical protein